MILRRILLFAVLVGALQLSAKALAACASPVGQRGDITWVAANSEFESCDGANWISTLVSTTANTCSTAGVMKYQSGSGDFQFCDGSYWNSMTGSLSSGTCTAGSTGVFRYNSSNSYHEWCDGSNWHNMYASPSWNLDFTTGTLPLQVQFSRATGSNTFAGTYYDSTGTLVTAPTNIVLQSQNFATTWALTNSTVTSNATTAPDGTSTATKLVESNDGAGSNLHYVNQSIASVAANQNWTFSIYAKAAERNQLTVLLYGGGGANASGGTFTLTGSGTSASTTAGTGVTASTSIQSLGNGWYRCVVTGQPATSGTGLTPQIMLMSGGTTYYAGTGSSGAYLWGAQVETGSQAKSYTYTTAAAANGPRFDYNPQTLALNGLLIEPESANLFPNSNSFAGSYCTLPTNAATAPDGTNTAVQIVEDNTNNRHFAYKGVTITANQIYTYSVYVKAGTRSRAWVSGGKSGSPYTRGGMLVDLTNGTFSQEFVGTPTAVSNMIVAPLPNGWYRISLSVLIDSTSTDGWMEVSTALPTGTSSAAVNYTGDSSSGIYIWGAQVEAGIGRSSYIPTSGTSLTRKADSAAALAGPWTSATQGTLLLNAISGPTLLNSGTSAFSPQIGASLETDSSNRLMLRRGSSSGAADGVGQGLYYSGAVINVGGSAADGSWPLLSSGSLAISYKANKFGWAHNGAVVGTATTGSVFTPTQLTIGGSLYYGFNFGGWIRKISFYPTALTNAQITHLTGNSGQP